MDKVDSKTNENQESTNKNENIDSDTTELVPKLLDLDDEKESLEESTTVETPEDFGLDHDTLCGAIETLIFMSDKPLSIFKLRDQIHPELPLVEIRKCITRLQEEYEQPHHGIRLVEVSDGHQFRTKAMYSKYVQKMFKVTSLMLGPTALEVLAIIAYRGPISRLDVDQIRGVDSSHIIRTLMDKKLVKLDKQGDDLGRQPLYRTTPDFLEMFNLNSLKDLPPEYEIEIMGQEKIKQNNEEVKTLIKNREQGELPNFDLEGLDSIGNLIKGISTETTLIKSLKAENKKTLKAQGQKQKEVKDGTVEAINIRTEEITPKSAFELLDECMARQEIGLQNQQAAVSVDQILIFNSLFDISVEPEKDSTEIELESNFDESEDEFFLDDEVELEQEPLSITEALEDLKNEQPNPSTDEDKTKMSYWLKDDEFMDDEEIDNSKSDSKVVPEEIIEKASEMELDLNFLNDDSPSNP